MRSVKIAAAVAATVVGLAITAASANSDQVATATSCLSIADQVKTALASNTQSANYDAARKESRFGLEFCNNSFYAQGMTHYNRALQLLGVSQKADASDNR